MKRPYKQRPKNHTKQIISRVPAELYKQVVEMSAMNKQPQSILIRDALNQYIENQKSVAA